jgi:hypothetical protein
MHTYTWPKRCPTVVTTSGSPVDPSWSPLIPWYPSPTVIIGKKPSPIMKRSPSPVIKGDPCISKSGINPITICLIRLESCVYIRNPYISVGRVTYPVSIWRKLVVKYLKRDIHWSFFCFDLIDRAENK